MESTRWVTHYGALQSEATDQSIDSELLFGRQTESEWLTERLDQDEPLLVVYGPARFGKTALLRHLEATLPFRYVAVYLDVGEIGGQGTRTPLHRVADEIARRVRAKTAVRTRTPDVRPFLQDPLGAWQGFVDAITAQLQVRRLVLLIDNLDQCLAVPVDPGSDETVDRDANWVRSLLQASVQCIFAVRSQEGLAQVLPESLRPPPSLGLGTLDNAAAESLVKALISLATQIDPRATHRIVEITSHHPYYIRQFCRVLLDCCPQKSPLTALDVEEALRLLLDDPPPEFPATWQGLMPQEQVVLCSMAALRGTRGAANQYDIQAFCEHHDFFLPLPEMVAALDRAVERGVLEKLGTNSYRFALELFRLWVNRYCTPERVRRESQWRLHSAAGAYQKAEIRRAIMRRPRLLMSIGIILLVALIVALQPAFRRKPHASRVSETLSTTSVGPVEATEAAGVSILSADTPVPTRVTTLPGYDIACMARADAQSPWQIHLLNSSTGARLPLTDTGSNERTPRWSPDGEQIVFASDRDGNREIYVLAIAGAVQGTGVEPRNLSRHKAPDWQPAWSPIGARVAFSSYRDDNWELYLVNADGSQLVRVTDHPENDFSPTWSPDGSKLLFASRRRVDADLFAVDVTSNEITQLTTSELNEFDPAWSPDGRWIAYVTQHGDQGDVYVMRADGANPINLTNSRYANDFQPVWTPDSQWVVFVSYTAAEGDHELFRMRPDGSQVERLTDDEYDTLAPSWRPSAR
jgi:TolB protein